MRSMIPNSRPSSMITMRLTMITMIFARDTPLATRISSQLMVPEGIPA